MRAFAAALLIALLPVTARANAAAGEKISHLCVSCHVADLTRPFLPVLDGQPRDFLIEQIYAFRARLRSIEAMAINADNLSPADIRNVAEYFAARKPARSPMLDPAQAPAGLAKLQRLHCASCHLPDYSGRGTAARLAGQNPKYIWWTLQDILRGARHHPAEAAPELKALSVEDIKRIANAFGAM